MTTNSPSSTAKKSLIGFKYRKFEDTAFTLDILDKLSTLEKHEYDIIIVDRDSYCTNRLSTKEPKPKLTYEYIKNKHNALEDISISSTFEGSRQRIPIKVKLEDNIFYFLSQNDYSVFEFQAKAIRYPELAFILYDVTAAQLVCYSEIKYNKTNSKNIIVPLNWAGKKYVIYKIKLEELRKQIPVYTKKVQESTK